MSKRRRRERARSEPEDAPSPLSGIALLLVESPVATLDLHGLTADRAESRLSDFLSTHSRASRGRVVHVISGKGTRSAGSAVLLDLTRGLLEQEHGRLVEERAGLPGGGGWAVRLR